ncbi:unnamed protein product [Pleuronectes platessa]|uniref:Uncharacterized protein n=1 Tax=Pleuronectes platessa TaxID=8262 RepID=A0A9N7W453_PLEPL|nr:unnamed protein product [Pleuronectes platessa]
MKIRTCELNNNQTKRDRESGICAVTDPPADVFLRLYDEDDKEGENISCLVLVVQVGLVQQGSIHSAANSSSDQSMPCQSSFSGLALGRRWLLIEPRTATLDSVRTSQNINGDGQRRLQEGGSGDGVLGSVPGRESNCAQVFQFH